MGFIILIGGLLTTVYVLVADGTFGALLDLYIVGQLFKGTDIIWFLFVDIIGKSLLNSFLSLEADYWGIFYLINLATMFTDGSFTPS
mmetsp:Transcript_23951/g.36698  ORF Transcript_23951/g.36698 Transcript_23951/m.36698 type:complete len:87 (-) Transcript_23951:322-582(-)